MFAARVTRPIVTVASTNTVPSVRFETPPTRRICHSRELLHDFPCADCGRAVRSPASVPPTDNQRVENPADDADHQGTDERPAETVNAEARDKPCGQLEADGVQHEDEQAEREERQ